MNILITGGAGFIGSSLADKLLTQGHTIIIIDNFNDYYNPQIKWQNVSANMGNTRYKLYRLDIENKIELECVFKENKIDVVIHLAGRAGVRPSILCPEKYVNCNILGTIHILELMKHYKVQKLIFASSSSVYGNSKAKYFSEDIKVSEPISHYAATKLSDELFIYTYTKLYDIKAICLRFFTVYGPRQRPDLAINKFTRFILNGKPIPVFGNGSTVRDYTYIDDILSGIEGAILYNKTNYEIINLGGGEPISLIKMIDTIEIELGKKAIIDWQPMQPGDVNRTICDYSKASNLLGYYPKIKFNQGIHKFIKWYLQK